MRKLDVTANVAKATEHLSDTARQHVPNAAAKALTWYSTYTPNAALSNLSLCVANQRFEIYFGVILRSREQNALPRQGSRSSFASTSNRHTYSINSPGPGWAARIVTSVAFNPDAYTCLAVCIMATAA
jgi:hypothetical protein